ncbi:MAG: PhnD/SsuA/transferrin family substrate-binding protein [Alphaproteobacteria bacterium]|nr:PhnD/SsuA/transferrin family substrate-binding protein [Alphaproteobacteria bacterium]
MIRRSLWGRRSVLAAGGAALLASGVSRAEESPVRFGLTPVFLDSDTQLLASLEQYLSDQIGRPVALIKKRTYQEITLMLLSGQLDAAWICGFPYVQYRDRLSLLAIPLYNGRPEYQAYLLAGAKSQARSLSDLKGQVHAFSDPDSNSGFLVTRALLARLEETPETFFTDTFFTYGHRNVIRAVSSGLANSGSVDGYVWDVMNSLQREMVLRTRVVRKSEWFGFPPIACTRASRDSKTVRHVAQALFDMPNHPRGRQILSTLHLDGFVEGDDRLFEGIARNVKLVRDQA